MASKNRNYAIISFLVLIFLIIVLYAFKVATDTKNKAETVNPVDALLQNGQKTPIITIFFKANTPQKDIFLLINNIKKLDGVTEVKYISKEQALALYNENNKSDPILQGLVTADVLPDSIEVYTTAGITNEQIDSLDRLTYR